jgi:hypothetical protein
LVALTALLIALSGCDDDDHRKDAGDVVPTDAVTDAPKVDAEDVVSDAPVMQQMHLRFANLSPGAPALDVCVQTAGRTTFTGPLASGLGITAGLQYTQVTEYIDLPIGAAVLRVVPAGATDCNTSLNGLSDFTLEALPANTTATVAAIGLVGGTNGTAFTLTVFLDDPAAPPAGEFRLTFVHVSPGTGPVDVGTLMDSTFTTLFDNVAYATTTASITGAAVPAPGVTIAVRLHGTTPGVGAFPLAVPGVVLAAGSNQTAYAIGILGNTATPLAMLLCHNFVEMNGLTQCAINP